MSLLAAMPRKEVSVAKVLKMTVIQSILSLHAQGWSQRRIAKTLAINRRTVSRYVRQQREWFKVHQTAD